MNPQANRGKGAEAGRQVFELLSKAGISAINLSAESANAALDNLKTAITDQEISGVISVGGDGTVQLGANICVPNQLPLGIVPAGSGNDISRELNIEAGGIEAAVQNILENLENPRRVDVMRVVNQDREFWSLGSISAGFDALCTERANRLVWPKGPNSYIAALFLELPSFRAIKYQLEADGVHREFEAMLCGVANVKNFGGGMQISPESDFTDGELEVFILHKVSRPRLLQIFPSVYKGEHLKYPEVEIFKAKSIRVSNSGFPMTCDGELSGRAPFSAQVHPGALALYSR